MEILPYLFAALIGAGLTAAVLDFAIAYARGNELLRMIAEKSGDVAHVWVDQPDKHAVRLNVRFRNNGPHSAPMVFKIDGVRELAKNLKLPFRDMRTGAEG